jgi:hypothetical protein
VNLLLERLGGFAARRYLIVIVGWVIVLTGLFVARHAFGGDYVNNYTVSGSESADGLNVLNDTFSGQGGYGGQIVFYAPGGKVSAHQSQVNQATANVAKLPHVIKAVSPFSASNTGQISKNSSIAYSNVSWNVNPYSLDTNYLHRLNQAVAPATKAGLLVDYGAGAGEIGQTNSDRTSEAIGLACALLLLLFMFGSVIAAAIPLVSALLSVGAGLSLLGLLAVPGRQELRPVPDGQAPRAAGRGPGRDHLGPARGGHLRRGDRRGRQHCRDLDPRALPGRGELRRRARTGRGGSGRPHDAGLADPSARVHGGGQGQRAQPVRAAEGQEGRHLGPCGGGGHRGGD